MATVRRRATLRERPRASRSAEARDKLLRPAKYSVPAAPRRSVQAKAFAAGRIGDSTWQLYNDDCRTLLPLLPEKSIDCVVTSPPYFWQRDYEVEGQIGLEDSIEGYVTNIRTMFRGLKHVLKDEGTVFLNLGDTYYSAKGLPRGKDEKNRARRFGLRLVDSSLLDLPRKTLIGIPWRTALALVDDGWRLRSPIVWVRQTSIPEPTAHDRPWRKYEFVFLFTKSPRYFFNRGGLGGEEDVWIIEPERNSSGKGTHFAPFPQALVEKCLAAGCPEGGVVLDPFVGSGTTMAVALAHGRSAVGIELNRQFCELSRDQLRRSPQATRLWPRQV